MNATAVSTTSNTFAFDTSVIRTVTDVEGTHWFNANDVCGALELANPRDALSKHVDPEDVAKRDTLTAGGPQATNHVNESGLYALILGSTKPEAKRFKRWVTSEVLPALRRTGSYTAGDSATAAPAVKQDCVAAILLIEQSMSKIPGIRPGILRAATLSCIQENTGISTQTLRRALPAADEPICTLNATQVGRELGLSAKAANQLLCAHGLQIRNERDDWELTEAGQDFAEALPFSRHGRSGFQILWSRDVVGRLQT